MYRNLLSVAVAVSLLLVPALASPVGATAVADVGTGFLNYRWSLPTAADTCGYGSGLDAFLGLTVAHVNDRLLVNFASDTRSLVTHSGNSDPFSHVNAECPMELAYDGGVVVNPCQTFDGSVPSPVSVAADPYFYRTSWDPSLYEKRISFPGGGSALYRLWVGTYADLGPFGTPPVTLLGNFDYYFYGNCSAPSGAQAQWSSAQDRAGANVYVP